MATKSITPGDTGINWESQEVAERRNVGGRAVSSFKGRQLNCCLTWPRFGPAARYSTWRPARGIKL